MKKGGRGTNLRRANRVENSQMWVRYKDQKKELRETYPDGMKKARELDGDPSTGRVVTKQLMERAGETGGALSAETLDEQVNEYLLFHGTSKSAAESIIDTGFRITSGADRFGKGAYFAEDIQKALNYAREEGIDGHRSRFVLVCRVACGDFLYTEEGHMEDATEQGKKAGKNATLANPKEAWGSWEPGTREFIIYESGQVYAEYILEIGH